MERGFFLFHGGSDLSLALQLADSGYLVVPLTPAADTSVSAGAPQDLVLAESTVQRAVGESGVQAEIMAREMLDAVAGEAPGLMRYEGLDLAPALFHGIYHYLAVEVAYARRIATLLAEQVGNGTKVAVGEDSHLADMVRRLMSELGVEVLRMGQESKVSSPSLGAVKGGSMRTLIRDAALLAKSVPKIPASDRPRVAMVATGKTQPVLCADVLRLLAEDYAIELYGSGLTPLVPEDLTPVRLGRLDEYSVRTPSSLRVRARHYRYGLRHLDAIRRSLRLEHWRWTDSLIESRLPVIIDRATYYAHQALTFAERCHPDIALMMDEKSLLARLIPQACAADSIPTLDMQHGVLAPDATVRNLSYTKIAVFGDSTRDVLVETGTGPGSIEVTGCPRFDALAAASPAPRERVLRESGLTGEKPVVLAATQPLKNTITTGAKREFVAGLARAAAGGHVQVLIKKHPYEKDAIVEQVCAGLDAVSIVEDGSLPDMIAASDAVTTIHSTVALEALILDRPVVVFRTPGTPVLVPYCSEEAADVAFDSESLAAALENAAMSGRGAAKAKRDAFLARHILLDGGSAERIAGLAMRLMGEGAG
ncbi:MAG: hypothetical protein C4521_09620 [Actinobacteria bacterium]|nr:MAG: hypothetical protein C4521_09620 [Actinomycetota bacterium]